jgi:hypothetical protein
MPCAFLSRRDEKDEVLLSGMTLSFITARRGVVRLAIEAVLLLVLICLIIWLGLAVQNVRRQIVLAQWQLELQAEGVSRTAALKMAVAEQDTTVKKILAYTPDESEIGDVVAALEGEASRLGLTLKIPLVQEVEDAAATESEGDEAEEQGEQTDALRDVRLRIIVAGPPERTLQFFYAIEHLPYLLRVGQWQFTTESKAAVPGRSLPIPGAGPGAAVLDPGAGLQGGTTANLTLNVLLSVRHIEAHED